MADPLSVLRDFCTAGRVEEVVVSPDGRAYFADQYSFPKATLTNFKSGAPPNDFYDLEAVIYYIRHTAASEQQRLAEYIAGCRANNIRAVVVVDRKPLRNYLLGLVDAAALPNLAEAAPAVLPLVEAEPAAKRQKVEEAHVDPLQATLRLLKKQERQLRDRNSMLLAPGGKSFKEVLDLVDRAQRLDAARLKEAQKKQALEQQQQQQRARASGAAGKSGGSKTPAFFLPSGRLERDTRAETAKALGQAEELGLGYGDAAIGGSQQQQQPGTAAAPPPPAAVAPAAPRPPPAAAAAAAAAADKQRRSGKSSSGSGGVKRDRAGAPAAAAAAAAGAAKPKKQGVPIILVPAGMSALVNMYNAKQLLADCTFVRSQDAMAANPTKASAATFHRSALREKPVSYMVTDKPPPKGSADWKRVVAVVVQGKAWQFKDFPFAGAAQGNLVDTFSKVMGVYFHFADERPPDAVRAWNVRHVPLQRESRHLDTAALLDMYKALDVFLAARRCELEY